MLVAVVIVGGNAVATFGDGSTKPKVLIAVIGAKPNATDNTTHEVPPSATSKEKGGTHAWHPDGYNGQSVDERKDQLDQENHDTEVRYFETLKDFLCWLCCREQNVSNRYRHVEIYGHGNPGGPMSQDGTTGFGTEDKSEEERAFEALGTLLGQHMESGTGKNGHILMGWCNAATRGTTQVPPKVVNGTSKNQYVGGILAKKSGKTVYGIGAKTENGDCGMAYEPERNQQDELENQNDGEKWAEPHPESTDVLVEHGWRAFDPNEPDTTKKPGVVVDATVNDAGLTQDPDRVDDVDPHHEDGPYPSPPVDNEPSASVTSEDVDCEELGCTCGSGGGE